MKRELFALSATLLALACTPANSETLMLTNHDGKTCENWMASQQTPNAPDTIALNNWVFGHLDGVAKFVDATYVMKGLPAPNMLNGLDRASVITLMSEYCRGTPGRTVHQALGALSAQLVASSAQIVKSNYSGPRRTIQR